MSARAVAARHVRAVSGGEAAYRAGRGGRAQPGCVLGGGHGHVEIAQVMLAGTIQYNTICIYLLDEEKQQAQEGVAGSAGPGGQAGAAATGRAGPIVGRWLEPAARAA